MTRETERRKTRLLNVARALRESPIPNAFTMRTYLHGDSYDEFYHDLDAKNWPCGTPACALGHYGARTDLQKTFKVKKVPSFSMDGSDALNVCSRANSYTISYNQSAVLNHFGIDSDQAENLFGPNGCGNAKTAIQAAKFIEKFVKEME